MLSYRVIGVDATADNVVVLLHGLFGSKGNLMSIGQALAENYHIVALDLPGHGKSDRMSEMTFPNMADAVLDILHQQGYEKVHLIGHSLGGKVAIQIASKHPQSVLSISVLDIAPVTYTNVGHNEIFGAIDSMVVSDISNRNDALAHFTAQGIEADVAKFILTNLQRTADGYRWRIDFSLLEKNYQNLSQAPVLDSVYSGPALVLKGELSAYIQSKHADAFARFLPQVEHHVVNGVGHWLHAEKPTQVQNLISSFLASLHQGDGA